MRPILRNSRCFRNAPIGRRTFSPLWDAPYETCAKARCENAKLLHSKPNHKSFSVVQCVLLHATDPPYLTTSLDFHRWIYETFRIVAYRGNVFEVDGAGWSDSQPKLLKDARLQN